MKKKKVDIIPPEAVSRLSYMRDMGERMLVLDLTEAKGAEPEPEGTPNDSAQRDMPEDSEARTGKAAVLAELNRSVEGCRRCKLAPTRKNIVFGVGDPDADIVFVGEAPGAEEDLRGEPFVGRAGKLLDKIFEAMGLSRESGVYICNILKCRPPGNRDPESDEVSQCIDYLTRQIEIIEPRVICCLGRIAAQQLLETGASLGNLRDKIHIYKDVPVIVTYHPAYLLRNPAGKIQTWEDMKKLMEIAGKPLK